MKAQSQPLTSASIERLFRTIAPGDFAGLPLYVCLSSEGLPAEYRPAHAIGYFGPKLDLALSTWLKSVGRWQDRGPAIVVDDIVLAEEADRLADGDEELRNELLFDRVLAISLHEGTHALQQPFDLVPAKTVGFVEFCSIQVAAFCNRDVACDLPNNVPWFGHDAEYIRLLLHTMARAESVLQRRVYSSLAFNSSHYELSSLLAYSARLGDEPEQFAGCHIHAINRIAPPAGFAELWRADVEYWLSAQRTQRDRFTKQEPAAVAALELFTS